VKTTRLVAFLSLTAAAAACSSGPDTIDLDHTQVQVNTIRQQIRELVPSIVDRADNAAAAAGESLAGLIPQTGVRPLITSLGLVPQTGVHPLMQLHKLWQHGTGTDPTTTSDTPASEPPTTPPQLPTRSHGDAVADYLLDNLFTESNFVDGEFKVPGKLICGDDTQCLDSIKTADVAVIATTAGRHGLTLELVTGLDREPGLTVSLAPQQLSFQADLGPLNPILRAKLHVSKGDLASEVSGVIDGSIAAWSNDDVTANVSISEPVHVALHPAGAQTDDDTLSLDLASAPSALSVHLDGPHHEVVTAAMLGSVVVRLPRSPDTATPSKIISLPAFQFSAVARHGEPMQIFALSLGDKPATITVGNEVAASLALNPDDGGAVDLSFESEADTGAIVIEASPRIDLQLAVDWSKLGSEAPASWPSRITLQGAVRILDREVQVLSGTMNVVVNPGGDTHTVQPGQCVSDGFRITDCGARSAG